MAHPTIPSTHFRFAKSWFLLAVFSLAIAGLFSLPPVILRGPFFAEHLPIKTIFDISLVIHVDASVLIWMLSIFGLFSTLFGKQSYAYIYKTNARLALAGLVLMACSAISPEAVALKNNYIPVIVNLPFFLGLSLFGCGIFVQAAATLWTGLSYQEKPYGVAVASSGLILLVSLLCFSIAESQLGTPDIRHLLSYYEQLFWGGGHILQFVYTNTLILAWLWLANQHLKKPIGCDALFIALFALQALLVLPMPLTYVIADSIETTTLWFTEHMRYTGGIAPIIAFFVILYKLYSQPKNNERWILLCLSLSIGLFAYGGILAFMIQGTNVTIPAHYHGSIVGITLAFMGVIYYFLPDMNYKKPSSKWIQIQLLVYGIGQFAHVTGLAWMGGYGALRKAPGSSTSVDTMIGKLLFFTGGGFAILGGLLFVILTLHCMLASKKSK